MPDARPPRRRLPRGTNALSREEVVRIQRERLLQGMVDAVFERGYLEARVADVIEHAGVSRAAFYDLFSSKEECFLAVRDEILSRTRARVLEAADELDDEPEPEQVLRWLFDAVVVATREHPREARLIVVDVLSLGAEGPTCRRETVMMLEALLRDRLPDEGTPGGFSDLAVATIASGAHQVLYNRLRRNAAGELRGLVEPLIQWAMTYRGANAPTVAPSPGASGDPDPDPPVLAARRLPSGRHQLPRSFVAHNQRERLLQAVTAVVATRGYAGLTVPLIAEAAGVSHQTFYEHFANKHEAFLAAIETTVTQLFTSAWNAFSTGREFGPAVRAALLAWADFLAAEPKLARFTTSDALTDGPVAAEIIDQSVSAFANLLTPGLEAMPLDARLPAIAPYAIIGAVFELTARLVADGLAAELPAHVDELAFVALTPFLGADAVPQPADAG